MSSSIAFSQGRLLLFAWFGALFIGVVLLTAYAVNTGLFAALAALPFLGALALPWHLRLSFVVSTACYQSAFIVPLVPGPLYAWLAACVPAWSGVGMLVLFRRTPSDLANNIRRNWPIFLGIAVYCANLMVIMQVRGFGIRALGGDGAMGGRVPLEQILCSILPLAFLCVRTSEREMSLLFKLQLLLTSTYLVSEFVIQWAPGQAFYLLYIFALSSDMLSFVQSEFFLFARYQSFKIAAPALLYLVLLLNRSTKLSNMAALYLAPVCLGLLALSTLSGHREALIFTILVVSVYLWAVRFFSLQTITSLAVSGLCIYVLLLFSVDYLPPAMQRSVSFIPGVQAESVAAFNAEDTLNLRWQLTKYGWSQLPEYALLGRGFLVLPSPTQLELQSILAKHVWSGHYYNGTIGLLVHTGLIGTLSAFAIYFGGVALAFRVVAQIRSMGGDHSVFDRAALLIASYCIVKPVYFLLLNGNAKVAMQEFMLPIALLLACERLLIQRTAHQNLTHPSALK